MSRLFVRIVRLRHSRRSGRLIRNNRRNFRRMLRAEAADYACIYVRNNPHFNAWLGYRNISRRVRRSAAAVFRDVRARNCSLWYFIAIVLLHQLYLAKKMKAERKFIKEGKCRNAIAFQVFLTLRNFLYAEYLMARFSWWSNSTALVAYLTDLLLNMLK